MITKYENNCIICGKPVVETHHLLSGPDRKKADQDGLVIPICSKCHTVDTQALHNSYVAAALSKICGQLAFEEQQCAKGMSIDEAREAFRKRYGESYL